MAVSNIITIKDPRSPVSEAYRTLRTNIQFSSFDNKIQTIVITSSGPSEGKSTTAANLAVTMAQAGYKTIIVDCDQRKPNLHKLFKISNQAGLSDFLIGEAGFEDVVQKTEVEDLYVLPAGTRPPNPAELLASVRMEKFIEYLKQQFDCIIFDTPPVIVVTDAQILSKYADGSLLVVSSGETERDAAARAKELLEKVNSRILGVVLNKLDTSRKGYYGNYYYYYYGSEGEKKGRRRRGVFKRFGKR
ncbi:CpsD/CapB family tyrosine-protein kinase [Fonticella tunisiensis]|uniref:non-specific protein-tyrosine kinase n=1 Tax=Fonticella tunisiensis TaxID=1096341 RepID=A0A4R7K511_9CLOT|nr:CpsD/CapB family tyrosine-protein kinase [Fonticella tunisiensis]TDT46090.1 capsular exopolysaccharide synthesis family protein [Fonticella tunisiensis]